MPVKLKLKLELKLISGPARLWNVRSEVMWAR
jgi:hypothetical protein